MTTLRRSAIATVVAVCLGSAACSSSSDSDAADAPAPAASTAASATSPAASPSPSASAAASAKPPASASAAPAASSTPKASPPAAAKGATIGIKDFKYAVAGSAAPGAKVTVTNNDTQAHTVSQDGGGVDVSILPGKTVTFDAPDKAGAFKFHCNFHGNMKGELEVA
ncbi:MAG TPA: cupredoxin domain-containing protein [Mycobacteriales bacterium]|nr:cupredoxin domain-containing protein [Mycobacteriales bacterium]